MKGLAPFWAAAGRPESSCALIFESRQERGPTYRFLPSRAFSWRIRKKLRLRATGLRQLFTCRLLIDDLGLRTLSGLSLRCLIS